MRDILEPQKKSQMVGDYYRVIGGTDPMRYKKGDRVWIIKPHKGDVILEVITDTDVDYQYIYSGKEFLFGERHVIGYA